MRASILLSVLFALVVRAAPAPQATDVSTAVTTDASAGGSTASIASTNAAITSSGASDAPLADETDAAVTSGPAGVEGTTAAISASGETASAETTGEPLSSDGIAASDPATTGVPSSAPVVGSAATDAIDVAATNSGHAPEPVESGAETCGTSGGVAGVNCPIASAPANGECVEDSNGAAHWNGGYKVACGTGTHCDMAKGGWCFGT